MSTTAPVASTSSDISQNTAIEIDGAAVYLNRTISAIGLITAVDRDRIEVLHHRRKRVTGTALADVQCTPYIKCIESSISGDFVSNVRIASLYGIEMNSLMTIRMPVYFRLMLQKLICEKKNRGGNRATKGNSGYQSPLQILVKCLCSWCTDHEVRAVRFQPFVYDQANRQIPVTIEPMTLADAALTDKEPLWQTSWTSAFLADSSF